MQNFRSTSQELPLKTCPKCFKKGMSEGTTWADTTLKWRCMYCSATLEINPKFKSNER